MRAEAFVRAHWWKRPWPVFVVIAALSVAVWQAVAADLTFSSDDWKVLSERTLSLPSLLTPYNEHLSAVPIAILVLLRDSIGLGWHGVYLLPLLLANAAGAAGILVVALRHQSPAVALVLATVGLFLGVGWNDLLWVWQVGAVISVAAGIWGMACLEAARPRRGPSAFLIAASLASSSFGIPFAVAAVALAVLRRDRRAFGYLAAVGVGYGVWYAIFHFTGQTLCGTPSAGQLLTTAPPFALATLTYAVGAPFGLGQSVQILMPAAAAIMTVWVVGLSAAWRQGHGLGLPVAAILGILATGVLVAYGRSCLGVQTPGASRYVYSTGMLVLLGFAGTRLSGPVVRAAGRIPRAAAVVGLALVLVLQSVAVAAGHAIMLESSDTVRAGIVVILEDGSGRCHTSPPVVDTTTADIDMLPDPVRLRALVSSAAQVAAPSWTGHAGPTAELTSRVRHLMCDPPSAGG